MERAVPLCECGVDSCGCPMVEISQTGIAIGKAESIYPGLVKLTPEGWNLLVEKVKSGELTTIKETASDCECGDC